MFCQADNLQNAAIKSTISLKAKTLCPLPLQSSSQPRNHGDNKDEAAFYLGREGWTAKLQTYKIVDLDKFE
jgi:hypothetical protein